MQGACRQRQLDSDARHRDSCDRVAWRDGKRGTKAQRIVSRPAILRFRTFPMTGSALRSPRTAITRAQTQTIAPISTLL